MTRFQDWLDLHKLRVEQVMNDFVDRQIKQDGRFSDAVRYAVQSDGKRIRPLLAYAAAEAAGVNLSVADYPAVAIELVHTYSLIHDDLPCMDNDSIRRGKLSTHKKFGESTAVLAGNSLLTLAFEILSDKSLLLKENTKVKLINLISECSGHTGIAGGQYLDLNYERKKIIKKKIIDMQIKKTGKLFAFCCIAPAIISNKNKKVIRFFEKIGYEIGLLFLITDDLIDYKGIARKAGKKTKKDKKKRKSYFSKFTGL